MPNKQGFTILELMVSIVVFTLGFLGAYLLIQSATNASNRSRDEIVGANILREQIELLKNMRDTNWIQLKTWDSIELAKVTSESDTTLRVNNFYIIENNYQDTKPIRIQKLTLPSLAEATILGEFQRTPSQIRLCMDTIGRYTHDCTGDKKKTNYASFLQIEPLITENTSTTTQINVDKAYKVTAYFISLNSGFRMTRMNTIITDWKNQ